MNSENESDDDGYEAPGKGAARRRVDAYRSPSRASSDARFEQPFVLEVRTWPPPRY
jgi:hypothetical protein